MEVMDGSLSSPRLCRTLWLMVSQQLSRNSSNRTKNITRYGRKDKQSETSHIQASDAMTALIGSLIIGSYLLVGPIVGGLCNKYEPRYVVILGGFISGLAFLVAPASPNIYVFMLIYGVLGGIGFGMIYLPAIVVVGFYFESKRAMATGISVAGSGVGTFVMPIICQVSIAGNFDCSSNKN